MTIRARLLIGFSALLILLLVQLGVTFYFSMKTEGTVRELLHAHDASASVTQMAIEAQKLRRYEKEYFIYVTNPEKRQKYLGEWRGARNELKNHLVRIASGVDPAWDADDLAKAKGWDAYLNTYADGFTKVDASVDQGFLNDTLSANSAIQPAKNAFRPFFTETTAQINDKLSAARGMADEVRSDFELIKLILLALAAASLVISAVVIVLVPNSISRPIRSLATVASEMSVGNVHREVRAQGAPEIRELAASIERLRIGMKGLLTRVQRPAPRSAA